MINFVDNSILEHKSKPPLRWIANISGSIGGWAILKIAIYDENENFGIRYKIYSVIYDMFMPTYFKYGSFYKLDIDMSGKEWNDYDENGIPYWEKLGVIDPDYYPTWDFIDEPTQEAFRIIKKKR